MFACGGEPPRVCPIRQPGVLEPRRDPEQQAPRDPPLRARAGLTLRLRAGRHRCRKLFGAASSNRGPPHPATRDADPKPNHRRDRRTRGQTSRRGIRDLPPVQRVLGILNPKPVSGAASGCELPSDHASVRNRDARSVRDQRECGQRFPKPRAHVRFMPGASRRPLGAGSWLVPTITVGLDSRGRSCCGATPQNGRATEALGVMQWSGG